MIRAQLCLNLLIKKMYENCIRHSAYRRETDLELVWLGYKLFLSRLEGLVFRRSWKNVVGKNIVDVS